MVGKFATVFFPLFMYVFKWALSNEFFGLHGIGTYVFKWAVCLHDGPVPVLGVQLRIIYMVPHPLFGLICIKYYFRWN